MHHATGGGRIRVRFDLERVIRVRNIVSKHLFYDFHLIEIDMSDLVSLGTLSGWLTLTKKAMAQGDVPPCKMPSSSSGKLLEENSLALLL
jgi:hypothetical protein